MSDLSPSHVVLAAPFPLDLNRAALFLDIDGTLFEIERRPQDVRIDAALCGMLRSLEDRTGGALAVLTGRGLADADRLLDGSVTCIGALHGQALRTRSQTLRQLQTESWPITKELVCRLIESGALAAELEDKGDALALHYRTRPEQSELVSRAADEIAEKYGLRAVHGKMVSELVPIGATKGIAVATYMREPAFAGRMPVVVGDDMTDEDAFAAANALGGVSVLVGERRPTSASYALPNVAAVRAWLGAAL